MDFCPTCNSRQTKTTHGIKCLKCDKDEIEKIKEESKKIKQESKNNGLTIPRFVLGEAFPFEKNQQYWQKDIRKSLGCNMMSGINYNKTGRFLTIFMNAHTPQEIQNNPYNDYYDSETGLYHYTGKGKKGDQTLTGVNKILDESNGKNIPIHFFKQDRKGEQHQYIGKVKLKKTVQNIQNDKDSQNRLAYEFLLEPIE